MRFHLRAIALAFIGVQIACLSTPAADAFDKTESKSVATGDTTPMASFARMEAGEWRLGGIQVDTWRWGPGGYSMRVLTVGSDGGGNPWSELVVYYWHPVRKQVCLLGFHPDIPGIGRGVATGTVRFSGDKATSTFDLYQPRRPKGRPRKMGGRWVFDGPDRYREELLEDSGQGLMPLAEWSWARSMARTKRASSSDDKALKPSKNLAAFESLLGHWRARYESAPEGEVELKTSVEWVEYLDVISLRVEKQTQDGPTLLLDAYLYHHVGTDSLHCLALTSSGGVYEGGVSRLADGALEINLTGGANEKTAAYKVRFDTQSDGTLRQRISSIDNGRSTPMLDVRHERIDPGRSPSRDKTHGERP